MSHEITPFEAIRRINPAGNGYWSSHDAAAGSQMLTITHSLPLA